MKQNRDYYYDYLKRVAHRLIEKDITFRFRGDSIEITSLEYGVFSTLTPHVETFYPIYMDGYFNQVDKRKVEQSLEL